MQYMIVCLSQGHSLNFELLENLKLSFKLKLCEPEIEIKTEIMTVSVIWPLKWVKSDSNLKIPITPRKLLQKTPVHVGGLYMHSPKITVKAITGIYLQEIQDLLYENLWASKLGYEILIYDPILFN